MLRSVLRHDPRLQTSVQRAVGLAEWEDIRLPTRRDVVKQCLAEGGGRAPLALVQSRIAALYGVAPPRHALAWNAWQLGARVMDDDLVMRDAGEPEAPSDILPGVPPGAWALFTALKAEGADDLEGRGAEVDAHVRRFFHEAVTNEAIDLTAVTAAQRKCHALLERARGGADDVRRLVHAAVCYFLREDDGAWDFTAGGLNDDLAVLNAVTASLGVDGATTHAG
jgi:hypothetical protein